jgi:hypothetical protein
MNGTGMQLLYNFQSYIVDPAMLLVFTTGFLVFIWGLVQFLWHIRDGSNHEDGVQHMLWGIIGMFIMVSVWGIIALIMNTIGVEAPKSSTPAGSSPPPGGFVI